MADDMAVYWEHRYRSGGDSGAGSRGAPAQAKADHVNAVLRRLAVASVVDWGCGDGAQLALYGLTGVAYTGVDVAPSALARCMRQHPRHAYLLWRPGRHLSVTADLALSVDVLFHFPDDEEYRGYLRRLFASARWHVLIHSTNRDEPASDHVRHRRVGDDIAELLPDWGMTDAGAGVNTCEFLLYAKDGRV